MKKQLLPIAVLAALPLSGASQDAAGHPSSFYWADYDGDGRKDALGVAPQGHARLLKNRADGVFEDVTELSGLELGRVSSVVWADFDGDEQVDLLVCDRAGSGGLWLADGRGTFADASAEFGLRDALAILGARVADLDGDAYPDLELLTTSGPALRRNVDGAYFEEVDLETPAAPPELPPSSVLIAVDEGEAPAPHAEGAAGSHTSSADKSVSKAGFSAKGSKSHSAEGTMMQSTGGFTATALVDMGAGGVLKASSAPTLGMLYPLSENLFVAGSGNVGIGTTEPGSTLHVDGGTDISLSDDGGYVVIGDIDGWNLGLDENQILARRNGAYEPLYLNSDPSDGSGPVVLGPVAGTVRCETTSVPLVFEETDQDGAGSLWRMPLDGKRLRFDYSLNGSDFSSHGTALTMESTGSVGIGETDPAARLHVDGGTDISLSDDGGYVVIGDIDGLNLGLDENQILARSNGSFGTLHLNSDGGLGAGPVVLGPVAGTVRCQTSAVPLVFEETDESGAGSLWRMPLDGGNLRFDYSTNGIDFSGYKTALQMSKDGTVAVDVLKINGADLVEAFDSAEGALEPGTVAVIDPRHPGKLKASVEEYDKAVAGVVSGAGNVKAGIQLIQEGVMDGDNLVAMTGRVYVKCTTENGAIEPGDRLTTASLAGHAMRVTDEMRSVGAVIGKAMTSLDEETGLVLVLVNLQ